MSEQLQVVPLLFYGITSFVVTVTNKLILTSFGFPSYGLVALAQMVSAVVVLGFLHLIHRIAIVPLTKTTFKKIWPLVVLNLLNVFFGLGGTKGLSLPMFVVLRHLSILCTFILEIVILKTHPSCKVGLSVCLIALGGIIAGASDLRFDLMAYLLVTINNLSTAGNNVLLKLRLTDKDIDKVSLAFYNFSLAIVPLTLFCATSGDFVEAALFEGWRSGSFVVLFLFSCPSAYLIFFSSAWCIEANSPLTTSIVGVTKNVLVTTVGMFVGGDYIFSWINFTGLVLGMVGVVMYIQAKQSHSSSPSAAKIDSSSNSSITPSDFKKNNGGANSIFESPLQQVIIPSDQLSVHGGKA